MINDWLGYGWLVENTWLWSWSYSIRNTHLHPLISCCFRVTSRTCASKCNASSFPSWCSNRSKKKEEPNGWTLKGYQEHVHRYALPCRFPPDVQITVTQGTTYDLMVSLYQVSCCCYYYRKIVIHSTYPEAEDKVSFNNAFALWRLQRNGTLADELLDIHPLILISPKTLESHPDFLKQQYRNIELQKDEIELWICYCTNNKENITKKTMIER